MAIQLYKYVETFPTTLQSALVNLFPSDYKAFLVLQDNMCEELGGRDADGKFNCDLAHPELFMNFLNSLGITAKDVENTDIQGSVRNLNNVFVRLASSLGPRKILAAIGPGGECLSGKWVPFLNAFSQA